MSGTINTSDLALIRRARRIGTIIPDVVIEETHSDRLQVTQHPIALGSPINDHAFRLPGTLTMRCGWRGTSETRPKEVYQLLRDLQGNINGVEVQLIDISTGKRDYTNMVMIELTVRTEQATENVIIVEAHFQEVFLVQTQSTTQPPVSAMGIADKTQAPTDTPAVQPKPVPEVAPSLLWQGKNYFFPGQA
jgi:hypothetical protein